jgi:hypothetical protein
VLDWRRAQEGIETASGDFGGRLVVHDALVVLEEEVLLLGEISGLERHLQIMRWLGRRRERGVFGLVDAFDEVEFLLIPFCCGSGFGMDASTGAKVGVPADVVAEAILRLALVLSGFVGQRVEPDGIVWTAGVSEVRLVECCARASPAATDEIFVELRG